MSKPILALILAGLLFAGGCRSTDPLWSFTCTRSAGPVVAPPALKLQANGAGETLAHIGLLAAFCLFPVALDVALLPLTLPHDLWIAVAPRSAPSETTLRDLGLAPAPPRCPETLRAVHALVVVYQRTTRRPFPPGAGADNLRALLRVALGTDPARVPWAGTAGEGSRAFETLDNRESSPTNIRRLEGVEYVSARCIPIVWDREGRHEGLRHVLFLDGHVEVVSEALFREEFGRFEGRPGR